MDTVSSQPAVPQVKRVVSRFTTTLLFCAVLLFSFASPLVHAQTVNSGLNYLESVIGPIFPVNGWAASFRSEIAAGMRVGVVQEARLSGGTLGNRSINLRDAARLDQYPFAIDVDAKLRFWRFGLRGHYQWFENRSRNSDWAKFVFTGLDLGADFDVMQFCTFAAGPCVDFWMYEPQFRGGLDPKYTGFRPPNDHLDVVGQKPTQIGAYFRYIPPDILGFPLHLEGFYKTKLQGSKFETYNFSMIFRPQMYRFDANCRLYLQRDMITFSDKDQVNYNGNSGNWNLEIDWMFYGFEIGIYF